MEVTPAGPGTPCAFGAEKEDFRDPPPPETDKIRELERHARSSPALKRHSRKRTEGVGSLPGSSVNEPR